MVELFANSLWDGFWLSSMTGKAIVLAQIAGSVLLLALAIGKFTTLHRAGQTTRRVSHDVMTGQNVLEYYLQRRPYPRSAVERIYVGACERLLTLLSPDARSAVAVRDGTAALSAHEVELVRALCEHTLDEGEIEVEHGMGFIGAIVALEPMLGLLGTVWGVLDAFADMGTAGSATIATMAPAISSALVTTVVGLLVAIPGVAAHTRLSASIRNITADLEGFTDDLVGRIALEYQGNK